MKTRTLDRLDLIAAEAEQKLLEEISRHNKTLQQIDYQRRVLAEYRARLTETWRGGGVVFAGQARRAETFVTASENAAEKIDAEEPRTQKMLDLALQNLAELQQRRRGFQDARRKILALEERDAERVLERDFNWRPPVAGVPK
jgi:flagellar biosynthesis chaperone FliJ